MDSEQFHPARTGTTAQQPGREAGVTILFLKTVFIVLRA
jgi:hypothetical protein